MCILVAKNLKTESRYISCVSMHVCYPFLYFVIANVSDIVFAFCLVGQAGVASDHRWRRRTAADADARTARQRQHGRHLVPADEARGEPHQDEAKHGRHRRIP